MLRRRKGLVAVCAAVGTAATGFIVQQVLTAGERAFSSTGAPLQVRIITDLALFRSSAAYVPAFVVPRSIADIGPPPNRYAADPSNPQEPPADDPARYSWAHRLGGVDADQTLVRLSISGTSSSATVLQQLRVRVLQCGPPLTGTDVSYRGLGDGIGVRYFFVVLDQSLPTVVYSWPDLRANGNQPFPLRVTNSIQEEFDVVGQVNHSDCDWELLLDWTQGTRNGTLTLSNDGKPLETTASSSPGVSEATWNPRQQR